MRRNVIAASRSGNMRFGDFELDLSSRNLSRDGQPVRIQPQPSRVLEILLERPGEIITREELRASIWGKATFVEFDQGLNYCIRQVRLALRDDASKPVYIETLPKLGYRFIARVTRIAAEEELAPEAAAPTAAPLVTSQKLRRVEVMAATLAAIAALSAYSFFRSGPAPVRFTQLTDLADSATGPSLSPDGRMLAFFRGSRSFLTADEIWVKMLPGGEARRLTNDPRLKYGISFSGDGSRISYTVLEGSSFAIYTVPVLGGDSRQLLVNAAGLSWLDPHRVLFSAIRTGQHLGVFSGTEMREDLKELYFPANERAMAHYSYASPDRKWALVVQMDEKGGWAPCELISLAASVPPERAGPKGACRSAGWSPDGKWMYFTADVSGQAHLWRERFPKGRPEQLTSGPTEEEGVAVEPDGRSMITSVGVRESSIWIHDDAGEHELPSEGEVETNRSPPSFSADGKTLYYLLRHPTSASSAELWRVNVASGASAPVFSEVAMTSYDISADGNQAVYSVEGNGEDSLLWITPMDRSTPPRRIGVKGDRSAHFGGHGEILFRATEGNVNYLERMNPDGSGRSKVVPFPVNQVLNVSPKRHWMIALAVPRQDQQIDVTAIPLDGGPARHLCASYCWPTWSSSGKYLFIPVEAPSATSSGRNLAIPLGPDEALPDFPEKGIEAGASPRVIPGAQNVPRGSLVPGSDISNYAYVNTTVHRNLYRVTLP